MNEHFLQVFLAAAIEEAEEKRKFDENDKFVQDADQDKLVQAADKFYASFESAVDPPLAVKRAIVVKFYHDLSKAETILKELRYSDVGGCYYFIYAGMFHGVEIDGYIHT